MASPTSTTTSAASEALDPSFALPRDLVLPDGTRLTLREIQPDDAPALKRAFDALSPLSRYRRFLRDMPEMTDGMLRYLTDIDGASHVALIAVLTSPDLKTEEIVGVARAIMTPTSQETHRAVRDEGKRSARKSRYSQLAEVAVVVADAMQRRGLGRLLLDAVRHAALARGIQAFRAEVLSSNEPVRLVLAQQGIEPVAQDAELLLYEIPLSDEPILGARESVFSRFLRVAASPVGMAIRSLRE